MSALAKEAFIFPGNSDLTLAQIFRELFSRLQHRHPHTPHFTEAELQHGLLTEMVVGHWEDQAMLIDSHLGSRLPAIFISEYLYVLDPTEQLCVLSPLHTRIDPATDAVQLETVRHLFNASLVLFS